MLRLAFRQLVGSALHKRAAVPLALPSKPSHCSVPVPRSPMTASCFPASRLEQHAAVRLGPNKAWSCRAISDQPFCPPTTTTQPACAQSRWRSTAHARNLQSRHTQAPSVTSPSNAQPSKPTHNCLQHQPHTVAAVRRPAHVAGAVESCGREGARLVSPSSQPATVDTICLAKSTHRTECRDR